MAVIDHSVVRISPDFKGFKTELEAALKKATAGVTGKVNVAVTVDSKALAASAREALKGADLTAHVRLVADGRGFNTSVKEELAKQAALKNKPVYRVRLVADARGFNDSVRDALKGKTGAGGATGAPRPRPTTTATTDAAAEAARETRQAERQAAQQAARETREAERQAAQQAKQVERQATQQAQQAAREAAQQAKQAAREAQQAQRQTERDAAREVREAKQQAARQEREAKQQAARAEREAKQAQRQAERDADKAARDKRRAERDAERESDRAERQELAERRKHYRKLREPEDVVARDKLRAGDTEQYGRFRSLAERWEKDWAEAHRVQRAQQKSAQDEAMRSYGEHIEKMDTLHQQALGMNAQYDQRARTREAAERVRDQRRQEREEEASARRRVRQVEADRRRRERGGSSGRRSSVFGDLSKAVGMPKLVNFGGEGVRPMNLLYAAAFALIPVMVSLASSAVQAGTSIVALGSAAYGGTLAVVGLTQAFAGVLGALKLHSSLLKTQQGKAGKAAKADVDNAGSIRNAYNSVLSAKEGVRDATDQLIDAQQNEKKAISAISQAYKDAAKRVRDLRQELRDLQLQREGDSLDLEEAQRKQREIDADFFATDLQRRQAAHDVREARSALTHDDTRIGDTRTELRERTRKGLDRSPEVVDARQAAGKAARDRADAQRNLAAAVRGVKEAQLDYADALKKTTTATGGVIAADGQLKAALKDLSPAGRAMYTWLVDHTEMFKKYRRSMEQAILPGFLDFLKSVSDRGKHGKTPSVLDVLVDGSNRIGRSISRTVKGLGLILKTPWFKGQLKKLNKDNEKSFDNIGKAGLALVKPITKLIVAASPLIVRFSKYLAKIAGQFADWIDQKDKAGALTQWFKDAGDRLAQWWDVVKNLGSFLLSIFTASLPTGDTLLTRIQTLTGQLADWAKSGKGQKKIKDFFDFFKTLDYVSIGKTVGVLIALFGALKVGQITAHHPLFTLLTMLAVKYPDTTAKILTDIAEALVKVMSWVDKHPTAVASLLGVLAAYKALTVLRGLKLPSLGKGGKGGILGSLLGDKTATMTVHAGVVNVYGPGGVPPLVPAGKVGGGIVRGLGTAALGLVVSDLIARALLDAGGGSKGDPLLALIKGPDSYAKWSKENAPAFQRFFSMTLPGWISGGGTRGWSSFKDAFINDFGAGAAHWFSVDLPNFLNLGEGQGGWAGLANNLGTWFSTTLPDTLNLGEGSGWGALGGNLRRWFAITLPNAMSGGEYSDGWSGFGRYVKETLKEQLGWNAVVGAWDGISEKSAWLWQHLVEWYHDVVNWVKKLFGINSPSTVFAGIGGELIAGLWQGFTGKWSGLVTTATTWINKNIIDKFKGVFSAGARAIKSVFVAPFSTLTGALAAPVGAVLDWLDKNVIDKVNVVLRVLPGVTTIPNIDSTLGDPGVQTGKNLAGALKKGAGLLHKADGGRVGGFSPHPKADNIPAMLTADEYVQPVDVVRHYGVDYMDALRRKEIPRFGAGGLVGALTADKGDNLVTRIGGGFIRKLGGDTIGAIVNTLKNVLFTPMGGGVASGDVGVAETAEATARAMGADNRQLLALIEAGLVESGLHNLNYGDRDSLGFLQQRASWGSAAARMDVAEATRKFIRKAKQVKGTEGMTAGQLAQAVQVSAFPAAYDRREGDAVAVLNRMAPYYGAGPSGGGGGSLAGLIAFGRMLQRLGYTVSENPAFGGVRGRHAKGSSHYRGTAIDVNHGSGTSTREQGYLSKIIPEAHKRGFRTIFMAPGHYDHAHIDLGAGRARGGLVRARSYDTGGVLEPGVTVAVNNTRRPETIRTAEQERALQQQGTRIDRRDLALLAGYIVTAMTGQSIKMDGRKVAETVRGYDYLPRGI